MPDCLKLVRPGPLGKCLNETASYFPLTDKGFCKAGDKTVRNSFDQVNLLTRAILDPR